MIIEPGPHDRRTLHPYLTVALTADRDRPRVEEVVRSWGSKIVGPDTLLMAAQDLALDRRPGRASTLAALNAAVVRAREDHQAAVERLQRAEARRQDLIESAEWALDAHAREPEWHDAVTAARSLVDEREGAAKSAADALERVLEQRATANAAMEEANSQLGDLAVVGMDESGLRRELEASGRAVQQAKEAYSQSADRLGQLRSERESLIERRDALVEALRAHAATDSVDRAAVERITDALAQWDRAAQVAPVDPEARELAQAWTDLQADLRSLTGDGRSAPDPARLMEAERRVERAVAELARIEAAAPAGELTEAERLELDAAHQAVLAAEERIGRRFGGRGAPKQLQDARDHEAALLAGFGFSSYIDVVLSGGRQQEESTDRFEADRELRQAVLERDGLKAALAGSPDLNHLQNETVRLHQHAMRLLGVDPEDQVIPLLRSHPMIPQPAVEELRRALESVGVVPVGQGLADAAAAWLAEQEERGAEHDRWAGAATAARQEVDELNGRLVALEDQVAGAEEAAARAAEALELSTRSVGAFEAELTVRVDEDAKRLKRFAAAEQLRHQIEALSATLVTAEADARSAIEAATAAHAEATHDLERATSVIEDALRRARQLMDQLPVDEQPTGERLEVLPALAGVLRVKADALTPEVDAAAAVVAAAETALEEARSVVEGAPSLTDDPRAEDFADAVARLLEGEPGQSVVLDHALDDVSPAERDAICTALLSERAGPVVILTADAALAGWAIELPSESGSVVTVEALVDTTPPPSPLRPEGSGPTIAHQSVDLDASPATAPRWAGRR